jgi:hypothetical protein
MESYQHLKDDKKSSTQNKLSSRNLTHDKSHHLKMSQRCHKVLSQNFINFINTHLKISLMPIMLSKQ